MKLFISYARVDKPYCKQIVGMLDEVHEVWYDHRLFAGQDWWSEIQQKIQWCEGFIYLLSPESVASEYCQKEYSFAKGLGKHIFPVLIQARVPIPNELSHIHYADLTEGLENVHVLLNALTVAERRGYSGFSTRFERTEIEESRIETKTSQGDFDPTVAFVEASQAMEKGAYDSALFLLKQMRDKEGVTKYLSRAVDGMLKEVEAILERQAFNRKAEREYKQIGKLIKNEATRRHGCQAFQAFQKDFPDYDPEFLASVCMDEVQGEIVEKEQARPHPTDDMPFADILDSLFRGSGFRSPTNPSNSLDVEQTITISFQDSILGTEALIEQENQHYKVKIPAGIQPNTRIRLSGKGKTGKADIPNGNLYLLVKVAEDDTFTREGDDIVTHCDISAKQAESGDKVVVPTVYGNVRLVIPPGIRDGKAICLTGKGAPKKRTDNTTGDEKGDQLVYIHVDAVRLPSTLSVETFGGVATPLLKRGTILPAEISQTYSTAGDDQTQVEVHLLFGESSVAKDNISLGNFILDGIPPAPRGAPKVEVKININKKLKMTVVATYRATNRTQSLDPIDLSKIKRQT